MKEKDDKMPELPIVRAVVQSHWSYTDSARVELPVLGITLSVDAHLKLHAGQRLVVVDADWLDGVLERFAGMGPNHYTWWKEQKETMRPRSLP